MFTKGFSTTLEGPANALAVNRDANLVAVAGRTVFKIFEINDDHFTEAFNLRVGKNLNLNYSCNDVAWNEVDDHLLATAATNGAIVTWDLHKQTRSKLDLVFQHHKRTVNKVCFHPSEAYLLLSGSQDGLMKLFDLRCKEATSTFISNSESVRYVQFAPSQANYFNFASVQETGNVEIWDIRRSDRPEINFLAHGGPVFACDWHPNPEKRKWLATAGRDKTIKVWDLSNPTKPHNLYTLHTIASVLRLKWRPSRDFQISSCSLLVDFSINVWDIRRPYVASAIFQEHKDVTTGFAWKNDPRILLSTSKDGTLYQHHFDTAFRPSLHYNPIGLSINPTGDVAFSASDHILRNSVYSGSKELVKAHSIGPNSSLTPITTVLSLTNYSKVRFSQLFKKPSDVSDQFKDVFSSLMLYKCPDNELADNLSMKWFVNLAKKYQLSGKSIEELCEYNACVAAEHNRTQVSQTWRILMQMFNTSIRSAHMSGANINQIAIGNITEFNDKNDLSHPSRHSSGSGGRHFSGNKVKDQLLANDASGNEEESDMSDIMDNIVQPKPKRVSQLTPQKHFNGEFFFSDIDMTTNQTKLDLIQNNNMTDVMSNQQDWVLPREAFFPRHPIQDYLIPPEMTETNEEPSSPKSETNEEEDVVDNMNYMSLNSSQWNSISLLSSKAPPNPVWPFTNLVADMLHFYAGQGDIQSSVSILLVLGDKMKTAIDVAVQQQWYQSYIDLLSRFELWNVANTVIRLCPHPYINTINHSSTTIYSTCGMCRKALVSRVGWICERCNSKPANCAICHVVVTGLYVWCQGCAHGGHLQHIQEWLTNNTLCPAGCGHHCEYT
ncbi:GATOR complex protein WDR24-like [Oppia nitens]|uniref:GATOR complex protein WDR24-like n=1 Tax=Oppia nitens TaxID=1686743 RepID=UPI0023DCB366|nr:GATOR complex protein WDR24-like [Oppia nitens]